MVTGDCAAKAGTDAEYAAFAQLLSHARVPVWLLPGNHDDATRMQSLLGVPHRDGRCDYAIDVPGGRVIMLDTSRPGREDGALDAEQITWLTDQLASQGDDRAALIAMHHPCIPVGGPAFRNIRLDDRSTNALHAAVTASLQRGARIHALVAGHAHMTCFGEFAGAKVVIAPSCAYEFGYVDGAFSYQLGEAQYMEYSWGSMGEDFLARVVTVDDSLWRPMHESHAVGEQR